MRFGYSIIYVPSVPDALDFYHRAFGFPTRFCVPSNDYGELELGDGRTTLAFARESLIHDSIGSETFRANRKDDAQAAGAQVSLVVDATKGETVESAFETAIKAGAQPVKGPTKKPWGQVVAYVRDLNGFIVELCTPVSA